MLFPIAMLDELVSGGEAMLIKYYCIECKDTIEAEAQDVEEDDEEEEEEDEDETTRDYPCGCVYDRLIAQNYLWREIITCVTHVVQGEGRTYECGCKAKLMEENGRIWQFKEECNIHGKEE